MKIASKIISFLFHPLIIPTLGIYLLFNSNSYLEYVIPHEMKNAILLLIGMSTFIIPALISLLLINKKIINSLEMETKKERIIPYSFTILFYIFTLYLLNKAPIPPIILKFITGATLALVIAFIINFKWKISAHMIGVGGLVGVLIAVSLLLNIYLLHFIVSILIISGLLGSARLILKAHTPIQIYGGFLLGVICQLTVLFLL